MRSTFVSVPRTLTCFCKRASSVIRSNSNLSDCFVLLSEKKKKKTDRDSHRVKSEELKEALEASKAREEATSARLAETLVELEVI